MLPIETPIRDAADAVRRVMAEEGRTRWTKADYEAVALMAAARLGIPHETDDCEVEKRAFRDKFGRT